MKKIFYIVSFTVLGIILQQVAHGLLEIWYINLLLKDFGTFSLGLDWKAWEMIHNVGAVIFFFAGLGLGWKGGTYWWHRLYETPEGEALRARKWFARWQRPNVQNS